MKNKIDNIISKVEDLHPYKEVGNRDSYSSYNEGWSDACDVLGSEIKENLPTLNDKINELAKKFCAKHDYYFDGWVGEEIGGIFSASDYFTNFLDAKFDIETNQPNDMFLKWYDYSYDQMILKKPINNYKTFCKKYG